MRLGMESMEKTKKNSTLEHGNQNPYQLEFENLAMLISPKKLQ